MIQKLPVFFLPVSNCYSACSGVVSILQAYDRRNPALFLNRLYLFRKPNNVLKFAFLEKTNKISLIRCNEENICEMLVKTLNNGDYVFLYLDHYFLTASSEFHISHFLHDFTLVYGYDSERQIFYCADNFRNGKYSQAEIPGHEVTVGRSTVPDSDNAQIVIFHYDRFVYNDWLDYKKIYLTMQDYMKSRFDSIIKMNPVFLSDNIFGFNNGQNCAYETCVFGIQIYDWLQDYMKNIEIFDLRSLHLLMNHQEILLYLMEYMRRHKEIADIYKYIDILGRQISDCQIARNLAIKCNMQYTSDIHKRIPDIIGKVYRQEYQFFEKLLSDRQIWDEIG
ncbi:MAG: BtrH N-terminal domain-containing protein [Acetatifactor sp.]|nr:BtrH N-terminal domain-containing protein [Acetatifactor sp.]